MSVYKSIRKQTAEEGYSVSDTVFGDLVGYARRKAEIAGQGEAYIPMLLPDVIREWCIRNAINAFSTEAMKIKG